MKYILRVCIPKYDTDKYVNQIIDICKYSHIKEIMVCEDNDYITAIAQPTDAHKKMAEILKTVVPKIKDNGIEVSFYLKALVGHSTSTSFALPYTKFVADDKTESVNECCIADEDFQDYAAKVLSYYAACGFSKIMLDDDFRSLNHCGCRNGCFCKEHIKRTSEIFGEELGADEVIRATKESGERNEKIYKAFKKANFAAQKECAKKIEKAVHGVDSNIDIGIMGSGLGSDEKQGRNQKELLRAFAGENGRIVFRPAGGTYRDSVGTDLIVGVENAEIYRRELGEDVKFISEIDVYMPRNIFTKSVKVLDSQIKTHIIGGNEDCTFNIIDHYGTSPYESMEYFDLLKNNYDEYQTIAKLRKGKTIAGIGVPLNAGNAEALSVTRDGILPGKTDSQLLSQLGFPVSFKEEEINYISLENLKSYSEKDLLRLMSKGLILDCDATRFLSEKGYSEFIGVKTGKEIDKPCYEVLSNTEYFGEYANDRIPAYVKNFFDSTKIYERKLENGCEIISEFKDGYLNYVSTASTIFKNKLGGTVMCNAVKFSVDNYLYKSKALMLNNVIRKMNDYIPFYLKNNVGIIPFYYKGKGKDVLFLYNSSFDDRKFTLCVHGEDIVTEVDALSVKMIEL